MSSSRLVSAESHVNFLTFDGRAVKILVKGFRNFRNMSSCTRWKNWFCHFKIARLSKGNSSQI